MVNITEERFDHKVELPILSKTVEINGKEYTGLTFEKETSGFLRDTMLEHVTRRFSEETGSQPLSLAEIFADTDAVKAIHELQEHFPIIRADTVYYSGHGNNLNHFGVPAEDKLQSDSIVIHGVGKTRTTEQITQRLIQNPDPHRRNHIVDPFTELPTQLFYGMKDVQKQEELEEKIRILNYEEFRYTEVRDKNKPFAIHASNPDYKLDTYFRPNYPVTEPTGLKEQDMFSPLSAMLLGSIGYTKHLVTEKRKDAERNILLVTNSDFADNHGYNRFGEVVNFFEAKGSHNRIEVDDGLYETPFFVKSNEGPSGISVTRANREGASSYLLRK